mgnify:CR=1 FL=1
MQHQAFYFSEHYRANLDTLFQSKTLPEDPSFHLTNPTITDPSLAPPGHSILYLFAPMPNLQAKRDWNVDAPVVREKLLRQLERLVDPDIRSVQFDERCSASRVSTTDRNPPNRRYSSIRQELTNWPL